jgi:hypothetical protein
MAMPVGPFQPLQDVLERLEARGCVRRQLSGQIVTPDGPVTIEYFHNPATGGFYVLDFAAGDKLAPSTIEHIERRLGVDLGFPKGAPWVPKKPNH